jgi:hypothetical protein
VDLRARGSVNGEEQRKPYGARSPALDKFAAAFSIGGEPQQKAADEKKGASLEHCSGILMLRKRGRNSSIPRKSKRPLIKISMVSAWAKKAVNSAPLRGASLDYYSVCRRLKSVLGAGREILASLTGLKTC